MMSVVISDIRMRDVMISDAMRVIIMSDVRMIDVMMSDVMSDDMMSVMMSDVLNAILPSVVIMSDVMMSDATMSDVIMSDVTSLATLHYFHKPFRLNKGTKIKMEQNALAYRGTLRVLFIDDFFSMSYLEQGRAQEQLCIARLHNMIVCSKYSQSCTIKLFLIYSLMFAVQ